MKIANYCTHCGKKLSQKFFTGRYSAYSGKPIYEFHCPEWFDPIGLGRVSDHD